MKTITISLVERRFITPTTRSAGGSSGPRFSISDLANELEIRVPKLHGWIQKEVITAGRGSLDDGHWPEDSSITGAQAFGEEWFLQKRSAVLSVPSAVIRSERNCVLNPHRADFAKVLVRPWTKLDLDPRLWNTA